MILKNFNNKNIKKVLNQELPSLEIRKLHLIDDGWENFVAVINEDLIVRFPKNKKTKFNLEIRILKKLKNNISIAIPEIKFIGKQYKFFAYNKIPGEKLNLKKLQNLSQKEKEELIFQLANFLKEIHNSISIKKARELGVLDEDHFSYINCIRSNLLDKVDKDLKSFILQVLVKYKEIKTLDKEIVFLYNDLHEDNLAFDEKNNKLNGIFDFGDVMIGDLNRDFCFLYRLDKNFMYEVGDKYQSLTNRELDYNRIILYSIVNELSDLSEAIENPQSKIYKNSLKNIKMFMQAGDYLKI